MLNHRKTRCETEDVKGDPMCMQMTGLRPYQKWHWAGDEIVYDAVIPAARRIPNTKPTNLPHRHPGVSFDRKQCRAAPCAAPDNRQASGRGCPPVFCSHSRAVSIFGRTPSRNSFPKRSDTSARRAGLTNGFSRRRRWRAAAVIAKTWRSCSRRF